jgi:predicted SAM-dependent methyltransferase
MIRVGSATYTRLNLGCGDIREKLLPSPWLNLDLDGPAGTYRCDVRRLPTEWTGAFEEVRASHVLEHIFLDRLESTLAEWIRVLAPGGVLRVIVPDLKLIVDCLTAGLDMKGRPAESISETTATLAQIYGVGYNSAETDSRWRHRMVFSESTLIGALAHTGALHSIGRYRCSDDPAAHYGIKDDSQNPFSLCVSGVSRNST